jgi:hypothetical protein
VKVRLSKRNVNKRVSGSESDERGCAGAATSTKGSDDLLCRGNWATNSLCPLYFVLLQQKEVDLELKLEQVDELQFKVQGQRRPRSEFSGIEDDTIAVPKNIRFLATLLGWAKISGIAFSGRIEMRAILLCY